MTASFEYSTCHPQLSEALQAKCLERLSREGSMKGYLTLHEIKGRGLAVKDSLFRSSDPYLKVYSENVPGTPEEVLAASSSPLISKSNTRRLWKSSVIKSNLNPTWSDLNVKLGPLQKGNNLKIDIWDKDALLTDDYMGSCNFSLLVVSLLQEEAKSDRISLTFALSSRSKVEVKGTLSLSVSWVDDPSTATAKMPSQPSSLSIPTKAPQEALEAQVSESPEEDERLYQESPTETVPPTLEVGVDAFKGKRPHMEDFHVMFTNLRETLASQFETLERWKDGRISFFGVYDGHGGTEAAERTATYLHKAFVESEGFAKGDIEAAWKFAFEETDRLILADSQREKWMSGTVVVAAVLIGTRLYVANVGDSELILGRRYTPLPNQAQNASPSTKYRVVVVSHKHKPTDPDEKARIEKAGAFVHNGRLCGTLAVSRALGDAMFKPPISDMYVSNEPFIAPPLELRRQDSFLVLGCDGLFDRMKYQDIIDFVTKARAAGTNPQDIARGLIKEATRRDSADNITAIVIFLNWSSPN